MLVRELDDCRCPRCGDRIGVGLKEEPTGWKVYAICLSDRPCYDRRAGTVSRESVASMDDVETAADRLVGRLCGE